MGGKPYLEPWPSSSCTRHVVTGKSYLDRSSILMGSFHKSVPVTETRLPEVGLPITPPHTHHPTHSVREEGQSSETWSPPLNVALDQALLRVVQHVPKTQRSEFSFFVKGRKGLPLYIFQDSVCCSARVLFVKQSTRERSQTCTGRCLIRTPGKSWAQGGMTFT